MDRIQKGRMAARISALALILAAPFVLAQPAYAGPAGGWDKIIRCESGNRNIEHGGDSGGVSTASGYLQFVNSTWRRYGGTDFAPRAIQASRKEQIAVAERVFKRNGLRDWSESRSCWNRGHRRHRH